MKVVAKAKKKKKANAELDAVRSRYDYAMAIFEIQDDTTKELLMSMEKTMERMQREGDSEVQRMMRRFISVRLVVACAKWDIRLASFKLPKKRCADCGVRA